MFDEICSIYADAFDNKGRYVDHETGECIQQMSIRDFCLTDRWKPEVEYLREMRQEFGVSAKKMQEYIDTKKRLPGATLSGLFGVWDDECTRKDGSKFTAPVSRRETHLQRHTGWLAIDIDLADNEQVTNFENIRMVCRFRPEIALLMRSCSGTGYFGLVRLAYPDRHKAQFKALLCEYAAIGITLDKQCGNIGRVRFASWDAPEHIYINERAVAYAGVYEEQEALPERVYIPINGNSNTQYAIRDGLNRDNHDVILRKAERLVQKIERRGVDILGCYDEWVRCGMALYDVDAVAGYDLWKRVSHFRPSDAAHGHHEADFSQNWNRFAGSKAHCDTFFWMCRESGVVLTKDELKGIYDEIR